MAESELHKKLKAKARSYLFDKGYRLSREEVYDGYYGIVDAWGINHVSLNTMGVEVKVSRSDWQAAKHKDRKLETTRKEGSSLLWTAMNEMYYLCPEGLIQPEEITESAGLLWYREETGRLINKKKPYFLKVHIKRKLQVVIGFSKGFYWNDA